MWQPRDPEVARLRDVIDAHLAALERRLTELETETDRQWATQEAAHAEYRKKVWQLALAAVTGLVLPLTVLGILAIVHTAH